MARLLWLPDVLRDAGCDVYVMPGAETCGREDITVKGVVWHHTATGLNWQDGHVASLLRNGRRDLAGPLSQAGLERDGTWVIVALGRANHNGYGTWGNDSLGVEMYNAGDGKDPWPAAQIESADRGTRAILNHLGLDAAGHLKAHRETDPKRKPDPVGVDMNDARARVAQQEDDMPTAAEIAAEVWKFPIDLTNGEKQPMWAVQRFIQQDAHNAAVGCAQILANQDPAKFAELLAAELEGVTVEQMEQAVRNVFADAAEG